MWSPVPLAIFPSAAAKIGGLAQHENSQLACEICSTNSKTTQSIQRR